MCFEIYSSRDFHSTLGVARTLETAVQRFRLYIIKPTVMLGTFNIIMFYSVSQVYVQLNNSNSIHQNDVIIITLQTANSHDAVTRILL